MAAVLELLAVLLARVAAITGLVQLLSSGVQAIQNYLNPATGISQITAIQNLVEVVKFDVADSTYSLLAIKTELDALQASVTALGGPQQAGVPVTLPPPPAGYGGLDAGGTGAAVWEYIDTYTSVSFGDQADYVYRDLTVRDFTLDSRVAQMPYFVANAIWGDAYFTPPPIVPPTTFDTSALSPSDTVYSILEASNPGTVWTLSIDGEHYEQVVGGGYGLVITCLVDAAQLAEMKEGAGVAAMANVAPVWPGLAKVTLGTPVALSAAVNVNVPMDGCLIALTATPPGKPVYTIGDQVATAHIGQVAFLDDNGEMEYPQNLSFPAEVYCPLSMAHAAGVKIRTVPGVSGSVTPWTITP